MARLFWVILVVSLILTGLVAVDSAPRLSLWYDVPPPERFRPFLLTALACVTLPVAAERHLGQRQSEPGFRGPAVALLGLAMMLIMSQLTAILIVLPADAPPGDYSTQVGLSLLDTGERPTVLREGVPASNFVQVDDVVAVR